MDMNLLRLLAGARLPCRLTDPREREAASLLEATGCITALIPPLQIDCDEHARQGDVIVVNVTPLGIAELARDAAREQAAQRARVPRSDGTPPRRSTLAWWRGDRLARPQR